MINLQTSTSFRVARWIAVSSKEQARTDKKKFSIENQLENTQRVIEEKGWRETTPPFIAKQSREQYIQLYQAEREIPAMRDLLAAARAGQFNLLVMTETDRMRGLLEQIFR